MVQLSITYMTTGKTIASMIHTFVGKVMRGVNAHVNSQMPWTQCVCVSNSVMSDSLWPHGLQPVRLLWPWNSPSKKMGVGSLSLLQEVFQTQGWNPGLLHCGQIFYRLSHLSSWTWQLMDNLMSFASCRFGDNKALKYFALLDFILIIGVLLLIRIDESWGKRDTWIVWPSQPWGN